MIDTWQWPDSVFGMLVLLVLFFQYLNLLFQISRREIEMDAVHFSRGELPGILFWDGDRESGEASGEESCI